MKFQDLKTTDVRMLSFHGLKITAVLAGDRVETFLFDSLVEYKEALRLWATIPDAEKPDLHSIEQVIIPLPLSNLQFAD